MKNTLDECLAEVDRWKEAAARGMEGLTAEQRRKEYEKARLWLEEELGRKLPEASPKASHVHNRTK